MLESLTKLGTPQIRKNYPIDKDSKAFTLPSPNKQKKKHLLVKPFTPFFFICGFPYLYLYLLYKNIDFFMPSN